MKHLMVLSMVAMLAACAGRSEPEGSFADPVCMPDGSVAFRQLANSKDQYGTPIAKKEYCPWNKK